jgi:hypothetical protein
MNEQPPRIRIHTESGYLLVRDGLSVTFYLRCAHPRIAQAVTCSLDAYLRAVGPDALSLYDDGQGQWRGLDDAGWAFVREKLRQPRSCNVCLTDSSPGGLRYRFDYHGSTLEPLPWEGDGSKKVSVVSFWLPTEYLEQHDPGRVRELALELAEPLPFCSGHAGLSFNGESNPLLLSEAEARKHCLRHPGLDVPNPYLKSHLGTRVKGVHWLNFLGQPVLGELGGAAGLRTRLHSPETTVRELDAERAVVTLGLWPEAGDTEQGDVLPAYRELARVVEPWLYREEPGRAHREVPEQVRHWERRFLD